MLYLIEVQPSYFPELFRGSKLELLDQTYFCVCLIKNTFSKCCSEWFEKLVYQFW